MKNICIFAAAKAIGVWCSWLAFLHGVQAVARSSRATPTKEQQMIRLLFLYYINHHSTTDYSNTKKQAPVYPVTRIR